MIYEQYYTTTSKFFVVGFAFIQFPVVEASELAYTDILLVKVNGESFDIITTGNPSNRKVRYRSGQGILQFDRNMGVSEVFVIYQH